MRELLFATEQIEHYRKQSLWSAITSGRHYGDRMQQHPRFNLSEHELSPNRGSFFREIEKSADQCGSELWRQIRRRSNYGGR